MKGNRKLGTIVFMVFLLLLPIILTGCVHERVEYITPSLPTFSPTRPIRPQLIEVDDSLQLPIPLVKNTIFLQGYARELEEYADGWETFYERLREDWGDAEYKGD